MTTSQPRDRLLAAGDRDGVTEAYERFIRLYEASPMNGSGF
jgi:hypothetical protein